MSLRHCVAAALLWLVHLTAQAASCQFDPIPSKDVSTALKLSEKYRAGALYSLVVATLPSGIDESQAGRALRDSVIPAAVKDAAGNGKALASLLHLGVLVMCENLDALKAPPAPAPQPAAGSAPAPAANAAPSQATLPASGGNEAPKTVQPPASQPQVPKQQDGAAGAPSPPSTSDDDEVLHTVAADLNGCTGMGCVNTISRAKDAADAYKLSDKPVSDKARPLVDACTFDKLQSPVVRSMQACTDAATKLHGDLSFDSISDKTAKQAKQSQADNDLAVFTARDALLQPHASLYVGPAYTLKSDGAFDSGGEVLGTFDAKALDAKPGLWNNLICPTFGGYTYWCRYSSEVDYSKQKFGSGETSGTFNPFKSKGGVLRVNEYVRVNFTDYLGLTYGGGFTAPIAPGAGAPSHIEPRFQLGLHYDTVYASNGKETAFGTLFGGIAHDQAWVTCAQPSPDASGMLPTVSCVSPERAYGRYIIDGRYLIPGVNIGDFKFAARIYIDGPLSGRGDYQVRLGILLFEDIEKWLSSPGSSK
jgi:hypothetical protein